MTLRLFKQAGRSGLVLWLRTGQVDPDRYPATAALIEQELLYPAHLHLCPGWVLNVLSTLNVPGYCTKNRAQRRGYTCTGLCPGCYGRYKHRYHF